MSAQTAATVQIYCVNLHKIPYMCIDKYANSHDKNDISDLTKGDVTSFSPVFIVHNGSDCVYYT